MTPSEFKAFAERYSEAIAEQAQDTFGAFMARVEAGEAPQDAIKAVMGGWVGSTEGTLSAAFSELLQRSIGVVELRALPVGYIDLSTHLYAQASATQSEVRQIVAMHTKGALQARELARSLYDGYNPGDGIKRPLEGLARGELPKYLRALTEDPPARAELTRLLEQMQAQAGRVKSDALRTAYLEAIDAWANAKDGAGNRAVRNALQTAIREKNRYFADRIARTELHRAHQVQVARDIMSDDTIDVVQVMLNPAHPQTDVCDLHGRANLWGLGPGCYPKTQAPRPGYHPHCWCYLRTRPSLSASDAQQVPSGEVAYLRGLGVASAAKVAGSRDKLQAILNGADPFALLDAGKPAQYRTLRLGNPAALEHPLMGDE